MLFFLLDRGNVWCILRLAVSKFQTYSFHIKNYFKFHAIFTTHFSVLGTAFPSKYPLDAIIPGGRHHGKNLSIHAVKTIKFSTEKQCLGVCTFITESTLMLVQYKANWFGAF